MGFNIYLFKVTDGVARELPYEDWGDAPHSEPTGKWDTCRYGYDHDYYCDLFENDVEGVYIPIEDDGEERMWRPSDARIAEIRVKYPDNPRAQLISAILASDPTIMVASL